MQNMGRPNRSQRIALILLFLICDHLAEMPTMFVEYSRARRQRDVGRLPRRVRLSRIRAAGDRADRRRQRRHGHGPSNRRADLRRRRTRRVLLPERHAGPGQRCPDQRRQRGAAAVGHQHQQPSKLLPVYALRERFGEAIDGLRVGVLGLAFKPNANGLHVAQAV